MQRKLIGHLEINPDKANYLSIETPVFESEKEGHGALQIVDGDKGLIIDFEDIPKEHFIPLYPQHFLKPVTAHKGEECIYLAKFNNKFFGEVKSLFISKLCRWMQDKECTYLNWFSLFILFNVRYKAFWAASKVIEENELQFKNLSIQNFSIPPPLPVHKSTLTLREIIEFYAKLTLDQNALLDFEWIFYSSENDLHTIALNQDNILIMGNYSIDANQFLSGLIEINKTLGRSRYDELIRRFQRCFLTLFDRLHVNMLTPGQLTERFETKIIKTSRQSGLLDFDDALLKELKDSIGIRWANDNNPARCRQCAAQEYNLY